MMINNNYYCYAEFRKAVENFTPSAIKDIQIY